MGNSLEKLETNINTLKNLIENFESKANSEEELSNFMSEYHQLENEILLLFKNNDTEDENEVEKMKILVDTFNKYWENSQDGWSDNYWKFYELAHKQSNLDTNINKNINILTQDEINNSNTQNQTNANMITKNNNTNLQTRTIINLQEIDEELDNINDLSIIKEKKNIE